MEEIARRRPIDATAARVTAAGPKGYESSKVILRTTSHAPLPTRRMPPGMPNLTGHVCGRLTVVSFSAIRGAGREKALWNCRCVCGYYTTRKAKAIKNPKNTKDACDRCQQLAYLKKYSHFQQTGQNVDA